MISIYNTSPLFPDRSPSRSGHLKSPTSPQIPFKRRREARKRATDQGPAYDWQQGPLFLHLCGNVDPNLSPERRTCPVPRSDPRLRLRLAEETACQTPRSSPLVRVPRGRRQTPGLGGWVCTAREDGSRTRRGRRGTKHRCAGVNALAKRDTQLTEPSAFYEGTKNAVINAVCGPHEQMGFLRSRLNTKHPIPNARDGLTAPRGDTETTTGEGVRSADRTR